MKKKTVWSIAAAMLLACLLALTAFAADTAITNANVNLRSGPGTTYNRITVIPAQTEVGIQASDSNGWTKVEYKGQVGYVLTSALGNNASGGTTTGTAGATGAGTYKTTDNVRLRSGAGTTYSILATVPKGTTVTVTAVSNGWATASYNGKSGYMSAQYLTSTGTAAGSTGGTGSTGTTGGTAGATGAGTYTTTHNVNMRASASTTAAVVTVVPKGASVTVTAVSNGWATASYNGKNGYMSAQYLTNGSGTAAGSATGAGTYTTTNNVNMRASASTTAAVVTIVPKGASVTVTAVSNGWATASYNGKNGYMVAQYLTNGSATAAGGATGTGSTATAAYNLHLRASASTSAAILATIPKGTAVTVTSTSNGWAAVTYNGQSGYVASQYLKTGGTTGTSNCTTTANVHLRSGAGTNYSILATVPKGTVITVTGTSNGWAAVTYNGKSGYISTQYISGLK